MQKILAIVWVLIPPLLLSALIHSADRDVGGLGGLADASVLFSVAFYGLPLVGVTLICLGLAVRFHWIAWASVSVGFSGVVALLLALLQTPRAGIARPFLGGTLLVWLFLALAVLPARALGWPRKGAKGERAA